MKTVLAIDDVATNLTTVRTILQDYYEVCLAKSVEGALTVLGRTGIDLILCDISMPGMDGFQFLAEIRRSPKYEKIPIVFITGHTSQEFVQKAISAKVDGYIIKPVNAEILLEKVHSLLYSKPEVVVKDSPEINTLINRLKQLVKFCEIGRAHQADATIRDLLKMPFNQQVIISNLNNIAKHISDIEYQEAIVNIRRLIKILSPMKQPPA